MMEGPWPSTITIMLQHTEHNRGSSSNVGLYIYTPPHANTWYPINPECDDKGKRTLVLWQEYYGRCALAYNCTMQHGRWEISPLHILSASISSSQILGQNIMSEEKCDVARGLTKCTLFQIYVLFTFYTSPKIL